MVIYLVQLVQAGNLAHLLLLPSLAGGNGGSLYLGRSLHTPGLFSLEYF